MSKATRAWEVPPTTAEHHLPQSLSQWRSAEMLAVERQLLVLLPQIEACLDEYQDPELDARIQHIKGLLVALAALPECAPPAPYVGKKPTPRSWRQNDDDDEWAKD